MEKPSIIIDASELSSYEICPFLWYSKYELKLRPKIAKVYMQQGSLLHVLLEYYYKSKRDTMKPLQQIVEEAAEHGRIEALKFEMLEPNEISEIVFQFREYCRYYENENWIPVHVEEPFIKLLHEDDDITIYASGRPDLIFKYAGTGSYAITDHKKVQRDTPVSQLRNQFMLYSCVLGIDTFVINKIGFQKTKKVQERFLRQPFTYHPDLIQEWKQDTILKIKELVMAKELSYFPRNRTACEKFGLCEMHKYCLTRPEAREFLIGTEYINDLNWDVTKELEDKA